jgi:hypothetical protein
LESNFSRINSSTKNDGCFMHFYSSQKNYFFYSLCLIPPN